MTDSPGIVVRYLHLDPPDFRVCTVRFVDKLFDSGSSSHSPQIFSSGSQISEFPCSVPLHPFLVTLHYRAVPQYPIIEPTFQPCIPTSQPCPILHTLTPQPSIPTSQPCPTPRTLTYQPSTPHIPALSHTPAAQYASPGILFH